LDEDKKRLAVICKTKHKIIGMKKTVLSGLYFIFFVAALALIIYRIYLRNHNRSEEAETVQWIALGLLVAALICRFIPKIFPKVFADKPTGEEIEKQVHGE
jgi:amino acid transporter